MSDLNRMTKSELIAEIRRLKGEPEPNFEQIYGRVEVARRPEKPKPIFAGTDVKKDDLLVVDEAKYLAFVHPEVKTVPNEIRIHGYASRNFKKGQQVKILHWLTYDPK